MTVPLIAKEEVVSCVTVDHVVADDDITCGWTLCHDRWTDCLNDVVGDEITRPVVLDAGWIGVVEMLTCIENIVALDYAVDALLYPDADIIRVQDGHPLAP